MVGEWGGVEREQGGEGTCVERQQQQQQQPHRESNACKFAPAGLGRVTPYIFGIFAMFAPNSGPIVLLFW